MSVCMWHSFFVVESQLSRKNRAFCNSGGPSPCKSSSHLYVYVQEKGGGKGNAKFGGQEIYIWFVVKWMNLFLVRRFVLSRPISEARLKTPPPFFFLLTFPSFFFRRQPDQLSGTRTRGGEGKEGQGGQEMVLAPPFTAPFLPCDLWDTFWMKIWEEKIFFLKKINLFPPLSPCLLACWCLSGCRVEDLVYPRKAPKLISSALRITYEKSLPWVRGTGLFGLTDVDSGSIWPCRREQVCRQREKTR